MNRRERTQRREFPLYETSNIDMDGLGDYAIKRWNQVGNHSTIRMHPAMAEVLRYVVMEAIAEVYEEGWMAGVAAGERDTIANPYEEEA